MTSRESLIMVLEQMIEAVKDEENSVLKATVSNAVVYEGATLELHVELLLRGVANDNIDRDPIYRGSE